MHTVDELYGGYIDEDSNTKKDEQQIYKIRETKYTLLLSLIELSTTKYIPIVIYSL